MLIYANQYGLTGKHHYKDTKALQKALNVAKKHPGSIVFVPKGTFYLKHALTIYQGTTLFLHEDTILMRQGNDTLLKNGMRNGLYHHYNGNSDITIIGGTFDMNGSRIPDNNTAMCMGHAKNITLYNVRFKDVVGGHAIDACGIDGLIVTRCRFEGFLDINGDRSFSEAIQLDIQVPGAFPKFGTRDGTITKNVAISECYFGPSETPGFSSWNRAIGSHGTRHNKFYENIYIYHNTFNETLDFALTPFKAKDLYIINNHFIHCAGGIRFLGTKDDKNTADVYTGQPQGPQGGTNINIINNRFDGKMTKEAIDIRGYFKTQHQNVLIANNHFDDISQTMNLNDIHGLIIKQSNLPLSNLNTINIRDMHSI